MPARRLSPKGVGDGSNQSKAGLASKNWTVKRVISRLGLLFELGGGEVALDAGEALGVMQAGDGVEDLLASDGVEGGAKVAGGILGRCGCSGRGGPRGGCPRRAPDTTGYAGVG